MKQNAFLTCSWRFFRSNTSEQFKLEKNNWDSETLQQKLENKLIFTSNFFFFQHKEAEFLQKLLPGYYMNLNQNPHTLLPKFFGMYTYQCNQKNIRVTIMNNLLPSNIKMHLKFDLKGSTFKRKVRLFDTNAFFIVKVSKSRKQFMVSTILPKNERNALRILS